MRRKDREIIDKNVICKIFSKADACRIAFGKPRPYIVVMNYGFKWNDDLIIYFHSSKEGKKIDLLYENSEVCFEIDTDHELVKSDSACNWGMKYASIVGYGILSIVENDNERIEGLNLIMNHYGFTGSPEYDPKIFSVTHVLKLTVTELNCKQKS